MNKWYRKADLRMVLLIVLFCAMGGCALPPQPMPDDPQYAPILSDMPAGAPTSQGAIPYGGFGLSLFSDRTASQVGDILTVVLVERTVSSKSAETSITKESETSFDSGILLGDDVSIGDYGFETEINQDRDFEGEAESDQSNSLQGSISVTVSSVLPNGNLVIRGEKWMRFNKGDEYLRLRGIVRPRDIGSDNTVLSTKIADARLTYSGTGSLANSNEMGWVSKFFNSPYWPF
jgi:flagellar L-ring protein precursor FlgH